MARIHFTKTYKNPEDLVSVLKSRNLKIEKEDWATRYIESVGYNICIIKYFLDVISPNNVMEAKLRWLFVDFPEIDLSAMGFPNGWEMEPLWQ